MPCACAQMHAHAFDVRLHMRAHARGPCHVICHVHRRLPCQLMLQFYWRNQDSHLLYHIPLPLAVL